MANIFKEAKKIKRLHPRYDWQRCIQEAGKKKKRSVSGTAKKKKKSSARQTGTSNKLYDEKRTARPPGARIPAGGKKVTYYERRKNRSDKPGSLTGVSASKLTSELKTRLKDQLGKSLVKQKFAPTATQRKKITKQVKQLTMQLRKLTV